MSFLGDLNWLAIIVTVVITMLIGLIWYSKKLFGDMWLRHQNFPEGKMESQKMDTKTIVLGWIFQFIIIGAYNYALMLMNINPFCVSALFVIGVILPLLAGSCVWEKKPWLIFWIHIGHWVVVFTIVATIFKLLTNY